jgi:hypothetical protein
VEVYEYAQKYLDGGLQPIPLAPGNKFPLSKCWPTIQYTPLDFMNACNIGLKLGRAGGNLVDVDLDSLAAVELAPKYLPLTGMISGRPGKPRSHWFYRTETTETRIQLTGWDDRAGKNQTVMELRANNHQTVAPPSTHPTAGGDYFWDSFQAPREITYEELKGAFDRLALALNIQWAPQVTRRPRAPEGVQPPFRLEKADLSEHVQKRLAGILKYRGQKYPSVEGEGGARNIMIVACIVTRGFILSDEAALDYLADWNEKYSQPPWDLEGENSLEDMIANVRDKGREPWGYLYVDWERPVLSPKERVLWKWAMSTYSPS